MTVVHPPRVTEPSLHAEFVSEYPYTRSTGPVIGAFLRGLGERRIMGITTSIGIMVPPQEYDPLTSADLTVDDLVDVGPSGSVESWTWVATPKAGNPLPDPFAFALVRLDGADRAMLSAVAAPGPDAMSVGMRVVARFAEERVGDIADLVCFDPA